MWKNNSNNNNRRYINRKINNLNNEMEKNSLVVIRGILHGFEINVIKHIKSFITLKDSRF